MATSKTHITSLRIVFMMILVIAFTKCSREEKGPNYETSAPEGQYQIGIYGHALDLTKGGGFIVSGYIKYLSKKDRDHDLWVMKADKAGNKEWCKTFGGESTDRAWSVRQMQDGNFLITGETYSFGKDYQIFLLKLDKTGKQVWGKLVGGDQAEHGMASFLNSDKRAYISGSAWSDSLGRANFYLSEISMQGQLFDEWTFDHDWQGGAAALTVLVDRDILMLGNIQNKMDRSVDLGLIRVDQSGVLVSKNRFGSVSSDEAGGVVATSDGGYLVAGTEFKDKINKRDAVVYKFNAADSIEWKQYFGGKSEDGAVNIISASDGGYVVIGYTQSSGAGFRDVYLIKLDAHGELEWSRTYGGKKTDWAYDIKQTPEGGFLISAGSKSTGQNATDIWILKVDKSGEKEWDRVYCTPAES
ncbi:MAG: hypothetical protein K9M49_05845 [Candidatus Marinimicrobia bacterium]|nr:hypothetical protein [Candidatus Neomarinimicrobiota bacterium]MCF7851405.1 hypothetical protein [Candidatus Neomarinimicrobiota bacterium]MCF7904656.1 hypothetical protein [Candidatus Neomarinimicrobiota bacterium]